MKTKEEMLEGLGYCGYDGKSHEFHTDRIERVREIIRLWLKPRKGVNCKCMGSYQLKHAAEDSELAEGLPLEGYVSNGEFIYAMILEGYDVKRSGINAYFNATSESMRRFYKVNRGRKNKQHRP